MKDFNSYFENNLSNSFREMNRLNSFLENVCGPVFKNQAIIDKTIRSQIEYASKLTDSLRPFHEAFQPATAAFAKINESGISKFIQEINKTNELFRKTAIASISDVIGRIQLPPPITIDTSFLSRIELLNNNFSEQLRSRISTDLISNLRENSGFTIPSDWDKKNLTDIYHDITTETVDTLDESKVFLYLVLVVVTITGIDISDIKNPEKRNIAWAQIFRFIFLLAIAQHEPKTNEPSYDVCMARRGCVVRVAPNYKSKRVIALPKDYMFKVLEENTDWYKVQFVDNALGFREGWIKKSLTTNYPQILPL